MNEYHYHIDEGALELVPGFRDATVNVFEWVLDTGRCTLMIQRELKGDRTLAKMVELTTAPYAKSFPAYAEEEPAELVMDVEAVSRRFRWRNEKGVQYHHQAFLDLGRQMLLLTASGSARAQEQVDEILMTALNGLRFRET